MRWLAFAILVAGCGVDGAPFEPHARGTIGVGTNGSFAGGEVEMTNGTVTIGVGL